MRMLIVAGALLISLTALLVLQSHALGGQAARKKPEGKAKTLIYQGITFTAANQAGRAFHVVAARKGKVIWEIGKAIATQAQKQGPFSDAIVDLEVKNVKAADLDSGSGQYLQMKRYIGKPALYIKETSAYSPLPSWLIVDINTGATIGIIAFN